MKELLLSPASRWAVVIGKMLASLAMSFASTILVLGVLIFLIGVYPVHWLAALGFVLLTLIIFISLGTLLGTLVKQRQAFIALAFGTSIPLFFLSGAFGPISFNVPALQVVAQIFPVYYAIVVLQYAFHNFTLNTYGLSTNMLILIGYALAFVLLATVILRRSTVAN